MLREAGQLLLQERLRVAGALMMPSTEQAHRGQSRILGVRWSVQGCAGGRSQRCFELMMRVEVQNEGRPKATKP